MIRFITICSMISLNAAVLTLAGCTLASSADAKSDPQKMGPVLKVETGNVVRRITVDGTLVSPSSKPILVERIGWSWEYTVSWVENEGTFVKAGAPVIRLDRSVLEKELAENKGKLEAALLELQETEIRTKDDISSAQSDVKTKEFDLKKAKLLVTDNDAIPAIEKKKQLIDVSSAEAALARAKERLATLKQASLRAIEVKKIPLATLRNQVEQAEKNLEKLELKAPQDGLFILRSFQSNSGWQKAATGTSVRSSTVIAEVANPSDLVARIYVPEIDAEGITAGTGASIALNSAPDEQVTGKVETVSSVPSSPSEREGGQSSSAADEVRQIEMKVSLSRLPRLAMPGMTVKVVLTPSEKSEVVRVPIEVLALTPAEGKHSQAGTQSAEKDVTKVATTQQTSSALAGEQEAEAKVSSEGGTPGSTEEVSPGSLAFAYVRKAGKKDWEWAQVKVGALSLAHAEILEGLSPGDEVRRVFRR